MSLKKTAKPDKSYLGNMYKKGFVPGEIVYWIDDEDKSLEINKVISIKMAKYLYRIKYNKNGQRCSVTDILKKNKHRNPVFIMSYSEGRTWPGWMSEDELFRFDKAAKVLYGSKETIDCARRLARKR